MPSSSSAVESLLKAHGFLYFLIYTFLKPGNSTKHVLDFKRICLAYSECYKMQIKTLASKGDVVL